MNPRLLILLAVLLAVFCPPLLGGEEVELSWKLEKGKTYLYRISTRSEVSFNIPMRGESKTVVNLENVAELETGSVKEGPPAEASMNGKYTHVVYHIEVPRQGSFSFDSDSELDRRDAATDPIKRGLLAMRTKKKLFTFKMGGRGGVSKMKGHSRVASRHFSGQGLKEPITIAANLVLRQMVKDSAVEETFNDVFIPFPKGKSLPDDQWEGESKALLYPLGTFIFKSQYTLKEVKEGKKAIISVTSEVSKDPRSEPGFGLPAKADPTWGRLKDMMKKFHVVSSKREGTFEFDLEKKEMVKGKVELTLELKGSFANPLSGEDFDIPLKAVHTRKLERVEEKK
ncbi:MAG: DUF6263 family protein [Planctomycetota bacterium]